MTTVTSTQLVNRLRRELTANPKKGAMLGLLAVVALYFWAPLVWGWFAKSDVLPGAVTPAPPDSAAVAGTSADPSKPETAAVSFPWRQVVQWIEADPLMRSASLLEKSKDPFVCAPKKKEVVEEKTADKPSPSKIVTPASLNMVLSSTLIGPRQRVAQINGRTYREGQTIELTAKDGQSTAFTLAEVHPTEVVLQRSAERFPLKIRKPAPSGRIELLGAAP